MSSNYGNEGTRRYNINELEERLDSNTPNSKKGKKPKKQKYKKPKSKGLQIFLKTLKCLIITIVILGILAGLIIAGIVAGLFLGLFGSDFKLTKEDLVLNYSNSEVYNSKGKLVATLSGNEKRKLISMSEMSEYVPKAYVAIEDERFYSHPGVDIKRTAAATVTYVIHRGHSNFGGSTITQQLVKNVTKDDEDTATRKIKEMAKALQVEKLISKDEILELYLNIIFVGGNNIHGVALGSEYYFSKDVSKLDLAEAAFMAGINNSPNMYKPFSKDKEDKEIIKNRTKTVLKKMKDLGSIDQSQYDKAVAEVDKGLKFKKGSLNSGEIHSYITECAVNQVIDQLMDEKGMSRDLAEATVYGGGLKIYTTEIEKYQKIMEKEMSKSKYIKASRKSKKKTTQAAMVMIDHKTGRVVAVQGKLGKKTTNGDLNRATQSLKQTGSSFKPLACVAPGIQEGVITAATSFTDKKVTYGRYSPKNYYSGYRGLMTIRHAIEISCNTVQVQVLHKLGVDTSIKYLKKMGFSTITKKDAGLALALGGLNRGVSPLEMAAAYACIANDGTYIEPTFYTKVLDNNDKEFLKPHQKKTKVLDKAAAYVVKSILTEPVYGSSGTAPYCKVPGIQTAAKTGTTNNDYDRWLCGFTPYYTAAVWYGYDKNETVYYYGSPSNPAGGIWSAVMKSCHAKLKNKSFKRPDGVVRATVCKKSGMVPKAGCTRITDYFVKGTVPKKACTGHGKDSVTLTICEDTGLIANDGCPHTKKVTFDKDDKSKPTKVCTKHKAKTKPKDDKKDDDKKEENKTTEDNSIVVPPENTTPDKDPENTTTSGT